MWIWDFPLFKNLSSFRGRKNEPSQPIALKALGLALFDVKVCKAPSLKKWLLNKKIIAH